MQRNTQRRFNCQRQNRKTVYFFSVKLITPFLLLIMLLFTAVFSAPASAAVLAMVAKGDDGSYHQYCYTELLDSYALKVMGRPNGLFEDFSGKRTRALLVANAGYIDYSDVLDQFALAVLRGERFMLNVFLGSGEARRAQMPATVMLTSVATGRKVHTAKSLVPVAPTINSPPASNQAGPGTALTLDQIPPPAPEPGMLTDFGPGSPSPLPAPVTATPMTVNPIVGQSTVSLARAQAWAASLRANQRFIDIAPLYWEFGLRTGIRPEVMFAQAALETGFGRYTGQVPPEFNNWAGIKTANASGDLPEDHQVFATPEDGVRAHFNHMAAYVGLPPIGEPHARYHLVMRLRWAGTIRTVEELSGRWAPSPTYHVAIVRLLTQMMTIN